jgi:hypothetical protein
MSKLELVPSESIAFTTYLHDLMTAQDVSEWYLQRMLNCRTAEPIQSWLKGWSRPPLWLLPALVNALKADPVDMTVGWIIDQLPEMELVLRHEVLIPRGSKFPRTDDFSCRAPKPRKEVLVT